MTEALGLALPLFWEMDGEYTVTYWTLVKLKIPFITWGEIFSNLVQGFAPQLTIL